MKLCVLGSGSKGNSVFIENRGTAILVDQGFSHKEMMKRLELRSLSVESIKAILLTHEHEDHIKGVGITARKLNIPVYGTPAALDKRQKIFNGSEELVAIESGEAFSLGPFEILPYRISHDAVDPVQYCIHSGNKKISIATDVGFVSTLVEQSLRGSDIIVLEANHDVEMLKKGPYPWSLKQRIMSREGHLSNRNAAEIIFNISTSKKCPAIVLAHLSDENNTPERAEKEIRDLFEKYDRPLNKLEVARQDIPSELIEI